MLCMCNLDSYYLLFSSILVLVLVMVKDKPCIYSHPIELYLDISKSLNMNVMCSQNKLNTRFQNREKKWINEIFEWGGGHTLFFVGFLENNMMGQPGNSLFPHAYLSPCLHFDLHQHQPLISQQLIHFLN
jgi:hypothetical protein